MDASINIPDKLLFEEVPCYISVQNSDCKILKTNRRFREMFGDRLGDYCYEVYKHRPDRCPVCTMDSTFNDGKVHQSETIVFSPEGLPIHVSVSSAPICDDEGNIIAVMEMATDITETKRLQRMLEESTEKYRTLYNEVPCFVSVQNRFLHIIDANRKFLDEYGSRQDEYCFKVYKLRNSRCEVCPVAEAFQDGKVHVSEEIIASKTGDPINVLVFAAPMHDANDNINSVIEMLTDITGIKQMKSQMASVGQLISGLAHTIKGIITGLEGGIYVVESGFSKKNDDTVKRGWEMVQRNVERVTHLVLDMLYFAKERIPDITEVDMAKICSEIHQLYEKKFKDNRIKCTLDIDEIAPYSGDNKSLYTLLLTLTENAIDSCKWDSSKSEHEIIISLKDKDDIVILSVEDNGVGISEEAKSKMFTTMYSTKGGHGSGFGLMVVKKIVDEHSGKISVDSVSGIGAKFKVALIRKLK